MKPKLHQSFTFCLIIPLIYYVSKIWGQFFDKLSIDDKSGVRFEKHPMVAVVLSKLNSGGGGAVARKMYTPARMATRNPYPHWHKICENPTLCGTEVGQNGTLAVLAYAYCRQWECPPGIKLHFCHPWTLFQNIAPQIFPGRFLYVES